MSASSSRWSSGKNGTALPLYMENVVPTYPEYEFRRLFHLSRCTVVALVAEFYPEDLRGRPEMPAQKTVLIALS